MNTVERLKEMDKRLYAMWRGADEVGAPIAASLKDLAEDIRSLIADLEREVLVDSDGWSYLGHLEHGRWGSLHIYETRPKDHIVEPVRVTITRREVQGG